VLALEGVVANKVRISDSWAVEVQSVQVSRGLAVLSERGLPRRVTNYDELMESLGGLVPSADEERHRSTALVEAGLERTLLALDGVYDARVHAVIPQRESRGLSREPPSPPRVSVVVTEGEARPAPSDHAIIAIVMGAVEGITPGTIAIVRSRVDLPEAPAATIETVGPFVVATESAKSLKATLLALAGVGILLAAGLIGAVLRGRR
jgi:type III secretion protein J